jgi:hypothetical protein
MGEKKNKSFWEKADVPNTLIFFLVPIILISIPILYPLAIPFTISSYTQDSWNAISALPEGSVVVHEYQAWPEYWDVTGAQMVAVNKVLFSKHIKVIFYCLEPRAVSIPMIRSINEANPEQFGAEYGKDYVVFGLVGGEEIGMASFASDIRATCAVDFYGTPTDEIEMLKNINSAKDVDLVISNIAYCSQADWIVRQWCQNYGLKAIVITAWGCVPTVAPYYPHYIVGVIPDVEGGAEIEYLSGFYGAGLSLIDAKSVGGFLIFGVFLAGNVVMIGLKLSKREEK